MGAWRARRKVYGRKAHSLAGRIGATLMLAVTILVVTALAGASPAAAAGSPTLGTLILRQPEAHWQAAPPAAVQPIVARLQKMYTNADQGRTVQVAAAMWRSPSGDGLLAITLSEWPADVANLGSTLRAGVRNECVAVTGDNPLSVTAVPGIRGSMAASCVAGGGGPELTVVGARKGTYVELVESIGVDTAPLDQATVDRFATAQYRALPAPPTNLTAIIGASAGGALLAAAALAVVLLARRARRQRAQYALGGPPAAPASAWATSGGGPWAGAADARLQAPMGGPLPSSVPLGSVEPGRVRFGDASRPVEAGPGPPLPRPPWLAGGAPPAPQASPSASQGPASRAPASPAPVVVPPRSRPAPPGVRPEAPAPRPRPVEAGPPAGWYPDGPDPRRRRYWDGSVWTTPIWWNGTSWVVADRPGH